MKDPIELKHELKNFTGTETWWRHNLNRAMTYTDGVKFFAENAGGGAYWFLDVVATEVFPLLKDEEFILVVLHSFDDKALLFADDGNGNKLWQRDIEYTDCPEGVWKFYLTDNVLLLPSEY